jgi:acetolactate synthase regulatory subunit
MLRKLQIQERASEKLLDIEPMSIGVIFMLRNFAIDAHRIHIELGLDDMRAVVSLLQNRIEQVELAMKEACREVEE